ncbi:flavin-containing monooxygenase [Georgenia subflava]|uniref:SidA/IucD/PvdA family monooxygenase n=1 Tax=Georgenia subflava TaxID=1622177 RepID=A0A6N7EFA2_9MICO|nr:NAD(P)-binding domain-containing protein [Georgenia subflava]MPV35628.1 SidA/IucD/PvdA family monooxygenase [Georgenia subflava]
MSTQHVETLIIGAGQAGLATGYHLQRQGREFLIVDANVRIGDNWRCHYDSLKLYSPVKYDGLPGMPFTGDPWHFPGKDEVADFLQAYAAEFDLPVRLRTRVEHLEARDGGGFGFVAHLGADVVECENVVLATGSFGRVPRVPELAERLDPAIRQLHSAEYKNPAQLQPGTTLVVGASHSGYDIAFEVGADRPTILVGPDRGNIPLEWNTRRFKMALPVIIFMWKHVLTRRTPMGRKEMQKVRHAGGPTTRVKPHHLAERGVDRLQEKVTDVSSDGRPVLADGRVLDVANVIWATGFRRDLDWVGAPLPMEDGWPVEHRGVVESVPGLYFCGLAFQYAFGSMVLPGVGRDAAYVARMIGARRRAKTPVATHRTSRDDEHRLV